MPVFHPPVPDSHSPPGRDKTGSRRTLEHFTGCLFSGAVGDALSAPVEFHSIHLIRNVYACPACQIEKEFFLICKKLPTNRLHDLTYIRKI